MRNTVRAIEISLINYSSIDLYTLSMVHTLFNLAKKNHYFRGYMAPEFIDSNPENRAITKKCDLYSLGVIIMELLTGTRKQCAVNDVRVTFLFLIYS